MSTDFRAMERTAFERGMSDYDRGYARTENPHKNNHATNEREEWYRGWDNAREMALDDEEDAK